MERAARQSLVLNDLVLRKRFDEESRAARDSLQQMTSKGLDPDEVLAWQPAYATPLRNCLEGPSATALERERLVAAEFRELDAVNCRYHRAYPATDRRAQHRAGQAARCQPHPPHPPSGAAIALSVMLAVGFGLWLARAIPPSGAGHRRPG